MHTDNMQLKLAQGCCQGFDKEVFVCCLCQKMHSKKSNLQRHMRINHQGMAAEPPQRQDVSDEQKQCKYCVQGFKDLKENLKGCSYMKRNPDRKAKTAYGDFLRDNVNLKRCANVNGHMVITLHNFKSRGIQAPPDDLGHPGVGGGALKLK